MRGEMQQGVETRTRAIASDGWRSRRSTPGQHNPPVWAPPVPEEKQTVINIVKKYYIRLVLLCHRFIRLPVMFAYLIGSNLIIRVFSAIGTKFFRANFMPLKRNPARSGMEAANA
jgi:hypothetical protein